MTQALIFDCFGVLVGKGFNHTYETAGGNPLEDRKFIEDTLGQANLGLISNQEFHGAMAQQLGISTAKWQEAVKQAEQLDTQLLDYIKQLRKTYKTAILSNANRGVLQYNLGDDILEACFDKLIVSGEIGIVKPDPRIYEYAAEQLGVDPSACIFIDDRQVFLDAAEKLGMKTILYQSYTQFKADLAKYLR